MTSLVVGIGAPTRGDDAVGIEVAKAVNGMGLAGVDVVESAEPIQLVDLIGDHPCVVIVDGMLSGAMPGEVAVFDGLPAPDFGPSSTHSLGVGQALAARILSAFELGRRIMAQRLEERPRVTSPADAANLLMADMMLLEQEHLRLILLDTRNRVLSVPTIYVGSLNTSVVRIGELLRAAIRANAAAFIAAHNHPSGDPSPSPEDVSVTRQIAQAGRLVDIEMLDHVIIGRQRYVSLKERGLGFDQ